MSCMGQHLDVFNKWNKVAYSIKIISLILKSLQNFDDNLGSLFVFKGIIKIKGTTSRCTGPKPQADFCHTRPCLDSLFIKDNILFLQAVSSDEFVVRPWETTRWELHDDE